MEEKRNILTLAGKRRLEDELAHLKTFRRPEVAQKIKEAMEQGDLSENAEYDAAKEESRDIESRIEELEDILKYAEIATDDNVEEGRVGIGSRVSVLDVDEDEIVDYMIVGSKEVNILENHISNESPVGRALLGAAVGDVVTVETMAGSMSFKVLDVRRDEGNEITDAG